VDVEPLTIATPSGGLSADFTWPREAGAVLVLAHGAGAGFRHPTMLAISEALAARAIASLRFNFPFIEAGRKRVDNPAVAVASIACAAGAAAARRPDLPLYLGGHSFGGRMASQALAQGRLVAGGLIAGGPIVRGLVCLSFPLHPANRPDTRRAAHLAAIDVPMLFLSGPRDALADASLLTQVVDDLARREHVPGVRLHWLDDADHGYRVRKRQRQDPRSVFEEVADEVASFVADTS
jgi:uncharacterized protein